MRLWIVAHDVPYPPVHGGRLDMWNRIVALSRRGVRVRLVTWTDGEVTEEHLGCMRGQIESVSVHQRNRAPYLALHPYYPTTVTSRALSRTAYEAELGAARAASPDLVFLDGLFGAILATSLARDLDLPLVYRSHNVEHRYMSELMAVEGRPIKRTVMKANVFRTKAIERRVRARSSLVYDISEEDRDSWRENETANKKSKVLGYYLHPDYVSPAVGAGSRADIDVLYVGNLHSVNNAFGLRWFVAGVAPMLKGLRVVVAGARPSPGLRGVLEGGGVELVADPEEVWSLYARARVLINPIWHGSGVNIKMVEMLATGRPVVSTSPGVRGLAGSLHRHVSVADDPTDFARCVRVRLAHAPSPTQRADVLDEHDPENVTYLIEDLRRVSDGG